MSTAAVCSGPLDFLRALVQRTPMNSSLKFETSKALDALRETLELREQQGLEYIFARCVLESCFAPASGAEQVHEFLVERFRNFDRRKQDLTLPEAPLPIVPRETQLARVAGFVQRRVALFRAIHLAAAIDCDGPWTKSEEKEAIYAILGRVVAGTR